MVDAGDRVRARRRLLRALPPWIALNVAAALLLAHGYVVTGGGPPSAAAWVYAQVAFATLIVGCGAALGAALAVLATLPGGVWAVRWLAPAAASLLLGFLWVDRAVFATYRFHLSGLAWSAWQLPGAFAQLGIWPPSPVLLLGAVAAVALLDALALRWLAARADLQPGDGRAAARGWVWLAAAMLALIVLERGIFLVSQQRGRRDVLRMARLVPFYPTLVGHDLPLLWTRRFAPGGEIPDIAPAPPPPIRFAPDAPRWNILWIVLDSWRADMLSAELTPAMWELARHARLFRAHTSGGNATRYGLVSMLYGLPAFQWPQLEVERRPPPLLSSLAGRGWDLGLFTSVDLPDINATVFGDVPAAWRIATPPERGARKDLATIAALERFLAVPRAGRPFFAFVHLISTHGPYDPTCELPRARRGPRARYERAVHCADRLVARALAGVSLADTIVVVTSDHGEAFGEDGAMGHAAGFHMVQLLVPFVLHVPGLPPAVVEHPTSHHDVPATLLDALGAELPSPAAGLGRSLLAGPGTPWLFACDDSECAIHDADGSVVFGVGVRHPGQVEIRDAAWTRVPTAGEVGRRRFSRVLEFLAWQRRALP